MDNLRKSNEVLDKFLKDRPDQSELVAKNILKDSSLAPALQVKEAELKRSQLENALKNKIERRPAPETLVEKHILEGQAA
ncbi:hypothetical protein BGX27_001780 [Mortierella sp. AM989]|nr:hypothetical protein BGX27_001780 [Mortierella sp. AM989]